MQFCLLCVTASSVILSYGMRHPLSAIDTLVVLSSGLRIPLSTNATFVVLSLGQRHCYFGDLGIWSETNATPLLLWYMQFCLLCSTATLLILSSALRHRLSAIALLVGLLFGLKHLLSANAPLVVL